MAGLAAVEDVVVVAVVVAEMADVESLITIKEKMMSIIPVVEVEMAKMENPKSHVNFIYHLNQQKMKRKFLEVALQAV